MEDNKFKWSWPLIGNEHIKVFLNKSLANDNLSSAYIFYGPDNLGKTTLARYFSMGLFCANKTKGGVMPCGSCKSCEQMEKGIHSDFHLIKKEPDKKNISVDQVREFIRTLNLTSFFNSYKIGVIKRADSLSLEAVNALLKILEEPKNKVVMILVTANLELLPATVVSRCQLLRFHQAKADAIHDFLIAKYGASRSVARDISRLSSGRPALAVKFFQNKEFYDNYLKRIGIFINFFYADFNQRSFFLEELLGKDAAGQASAKLAFHLIESWQGIARDLIFLHYDQANLAQNYMFFDELNKVKQGFKVDYFLRLIYLLRQARELIKANVNVKLAMESIALNL